MSKIIITKPTADWGSIIVETFNSTVIPVMQENLQEYAETIVTRLQDKIRSNAFNFKAERSESRRHNSYLAWKAKHGNSTNPLMFTGEYVDSISAIPVYDSTGNGLPTAYVVGFRNEEHTPIMRKKTLRAAYSQMTKEDLTTTIKRLKAKKLEKVIEKMYVKQKKPVKMIDLARWLEFGVPSRNIPARPHWRPVLQQIKKESNRLKKNWTADMKTATRSALAEFLKHTKKEETTV